MEINLPNININGVFDIEEYCNNKNINLKDVTSLYCSNNKITELEGLDKLVNLEELYCYDNQIEELKGLDKLVNLRYLFCFGNPFKIQNLTELKKLSKKITVICQL